MIKREKVRERERDKETYSKMNKREKVEREKE